MGQLSLGHRSVALPWALEASAVSHLAARQCRREAASGAVHPDLAPTVGEAADQGAAAAAAAAVLDGEAAVAQKACFAALQQRPAVQLNVTKHLVAQHSVENNLSVAEGQQALMWRAVQGRPDRQIDVTAFPQALQQTVQLEQEQRPAGCHAADGGLLLALLAVPLHLQTVVSQAVLPGQLAVPGPQCVAEHVERATAVLQWAEMQQLAGVAAQQDPVGVTMLSPTRHVHYGVQQQALACSTQGTAWQCWQWCCEAPPLAQARPIRGIAWHCQH